MVRWSAALGAVAVISLASPAFAFHSDPACDMGSLAGNCTINTVHNNIPVIPANIYDVFGNLLVTETGALNFAGAATVTVGGDLQVDAGLAAGLGQISSRGSDGGAGGNGDNGASLTLNVVGNAEVSGLVTTEGGKGGNGGNATSGNAQNGGNGGNSGQLTITSESSVLVDGTVTTRGGNGGNGGNRTGSGNGDGGDAGNAGNAGILTIEACENIEIADTDPEVSARGGNGGNGGNGRGTGSPGDNGEGGGGNDIIISGDGLITIAAKVHAQGGNGGGPAATRVDGEDGSIIINTPSLETDGAVDVSGADFNPDPPTINYEQEPVCECPA